MHEAPVEERDRDRCKMVVVRSEKKQTKQNVLISLRCRRGDLDVDIAIPGVDIAIFGVADLRRQGNKRGRLQERVDGAVLGVDIAVLDVDQSVPAGIAIRDE